jgi:hypothetical protein
MGLWKALEAQNVKMTKREPRSEKTEQVRSMMLTVSISEAARAGVGLSISSSGAWRRRVAAEEVQVFANFRREVVPRCRP